MDSGRCSSRPSPLRLRLLAVGRLCHWRQNDLPTLLRILEKTHRPCRPRAANEIVESPSTIRGCGASISAQTAEGGSAKRPRIHVHQSAKTSKSQPQCLNATHPHMRVHRRELAMLPISRRILSCATQKPSNRPCLVLTTREGTTAAAAGSATNPARKFGGIGKTLVETVNNSLSIA